jgi:hypothetical protein
MIFRKFKKSTFEMLIRQHYTKKNTHVPIFAKSGILRTIYANTVDRKA